MHLGCLLPKSKSPRNKRWSEKVDIIFYTHLIQIQHNAVNFKMFDISCLVNIILSLFCSDLYSHSLSQGGTPARFLIIDDGWQDTSNEFQKEGEPFVEGSQ